MWSLLDMLRISQRGIKLLSSVYHLIWCWTKKVVVREDMYILWLVFHCMYTLKNIDKIQGFFRNQGLNHGSPSGISKIHWAARWALGPDKLPFAFFKYPLDFVGFRNWFPPKNPNFLCHIFILWSEYSFYWFWFKFPL